MNGGSIPARPPLASRSLLFVRVESWMPVNFTAGMHEVLDVTPSPAEALVASTCPSCSKSLGPTGPVVVLPSALHQVLYIKDIFLAISVPTLPPEVRCVSDFILAIGDHRFDNYNSWAAEIVRVRAGKSEESSCCFVLDAFEHDSLEIPPRQFLLCHLFPAGSFPHSASALNAAWEGSL